MGMLGGKIGPMIDEASDGLIKQGDFDKLMATVTKNIADGILKRYGIHVVITVSAPVYQGVRCGAVAQPQAALQQPTTTPDPAATPAPAPNKGP